MNRRARRAAARLKLTREQRMEPTEHAEVIAEMRRIWPDGRIPFADRVRLAEKLDVPVPDITPDQVRAAE